MAAMHSKKEPMEEQIREEDTMQELAEDDQTKDDQPFPFLDLPAELRDIVYHELLEGDCRVDLWRGRRHYSNSIGLRLQTGCHPNISTSILLVNKQIYNEAVPVLYSSNTFSLHNFYDAAAFVKHIGEPLRHLDHLRVKFDSTKKAVQQMLVALKPARQLSCLALPSLMMTKAGGRWYYSPVTLAKQLTPFFRALNRYQKKDDERKPRDLTDVLTIHTEDFKSFTIADAAGMKTYGEQNAPLEQEVKELLAAALK